MSSKPRARKFFYWHLLLLGSLSISMPLFSTMSSQPEFLLAHDLTGLNLLLWICVVGFLPALLAVLLVWILATILKPLADPIRITALFTLFAMFVFVHVNRTFEPGPFLSVTLAGVFALVFVYLYGRSIFLRTFLSVAGLLFIVSPVLFAAHPNIRQILLPQSGIHDANSDKAVSDNPVVVLMLDELSMLSLLDSRGEINSLRYPNLAGFAAQSTWYKYATTVAEATLMAVPPVLTGRESKAKDKKLPLAANYPDNLFTLLARTHDLNVFETFTHLCPDYLCDTSEPDWRLIAEDSLVVFAYIATPNRFKRRLPRIDNKWVGYLRSDATGRNLHTDRDLHPHHRYRVRLEKFGQFLTELEKVGRSSLNYLHLLIPHSPWMYLPDGRIYAHTEQPSFTGTLPAGTSGLEHSKQLYSQQHLMDFAQQRYLLQTAYTDRLLGKVFSVMRERGLYDDALIVVMSDHGVSFRPGESLREATDRNFEEILSVPLFIKFPGQQRPEVSLEAARTIDVLPTILDSLGIDGEQFKFEGRPLSRPNGNEPEVITVQRDTGEKLTFEFARFREHFERAVRTRKPEFADGAIDEVFRVNGRDLVGRDLRDLSVSPAAAYTLRLDNPHLYRDIDPGYESIPALIRANRSDGTGSSDGVPVAVAVNGIVRGVSVLQRVETLPFDFQVVVSPTSFRNGANTVSFYQVNREQGITWLAPIRSESSGRAELLIADGRASELVLESGRLPVSGIRKFGEITLIPDEESGQVRLTGWSANSDSGQAADEIFFFADTELITSVKPHLPSPGARKSTGFDSAGHSGFNLSVPFTLPLADGNKASRRLFSAIAVFPSDPRPLAGELSYSNDAQQIFRTRTRVGLDQMLEGRKGTEIIALGQVYDFADDAQATLLAGYGWSRRSSSGARWNAADEAILEFAVPVGSGPLDVIVQSAPFFVKGKLENQSIEASFASGRRELIELGMGKTDGRFTLRVASEDIDNAGRVAIMLKFANAVSPQSLNLNTDGRLLAIKVQTIQVVATRQASP